MRVLHVIVSLFLLCISQTGCFYWSRSVVGGGRIRDGKYYVLEQSVWTWCWFTAFYPSARINMRVWSEVCPEEGNAKSCVDWAFWCREASEPSLAHTELLQRWMLGKSLVRPIVLTTDQRLLMLCQDTANYALLIQEQKRLDRMYRKNTLGQTGSTTYTETIETALPRVEKCTFWIVQPDDTLIGPYLLPYMTDTWRDFHGQKLRTRYRENALFCFEPESQTLCMLYLEESSSEEHRWYFESWQVQGTQPQQRARLQMNNGTEPFYFWVSANTVGIAFWGQARTGAIFTTFDRASFKKLHSVSAPLFPQPPIHGEESEGVIVRHSNPFVKTPELICKNGDWLYIKSARYHSTYSSLFLPFFHTEARENLSDGEKREYILRFNLTTGVREGYYVQER